MKNNVDSATGSTDGATQHPVLRGSAAEVSAVASPPIDVSMVAAASTPSVTEATRPPVATWLLQRNFAGAAATATSSLSSLSDSTGPDITKPTENQ